MFDARDRLVRRTDSAGRVVEYTYDAKGNLRSRVTASQSLVYAYDARDRLVGVTATVGNQPPRTTRYTYDEVGLRTGMIAADGTTTAYAYDRRNRLVGLVQRTAAAALLFGATYTVDATGLRTAAQESDASGVVRTLGWTYDALERLVGESIDHRDATRDRTSAWTYDRVGNRLTQTVTTGSGAAARTTITTATYDTNDRLTQESTRENGGAAQVTTFAYDAQGNTLTRTAPGGVTEYTWDDANRLVEQREGGSRTTYRYDADGLRIGQTTFPAAGSPTRTDYLVDPSYAYANVIERFEGSAATGAAAPKLAAVFAFGEGIVGQTSCAPTATSGAHDCPGAIERNIHADGFGSTRLLTDATGAITDRIDYDAFGNEIHREGTTSVEHLYRGEQFDPNLGWYYLRARYMDPGRGKFASMDGFAGHTMDPASLHKYTLDHNDPINRIDPSGNESLINLTTAINIVGFGNLAINAGFRIAEGDHQGAAEEVARDAVFWALGAGAGRLVAPLSKSALSLFSRTFMAPLTLGMQRSSAVLAQNMEAVMRMARPRGWQAHHIVGEAYPEGRAAMEILRRFKIDVNSPLNGVYLPGCGATGSTGVAGLAVHCGKHVQAYETYVLRQLRDASSESDAVNILSRIRRELMDGELFLNTRGNL